MSQHTDDPIDSAEATDDLPELSYAGVESFLKGHATRRRPPRRRDGSGGELCIRTDAYADD